MTRSAPPASRLLPGGVSASSPIAVLGVAADPDRATVLDEHLRGDDRIRLETVVTPAAAPAHFDSVDCVVGESDLAPDPVLDLLAAIRDRDRALPFVLLTRDPPRAVLDALDETDWTDRVRATGDGTAPLAGRIDALVGYCRATVLARRALAALAQGSDAIAIVDPDGYVEFANPLFARQFGVTSKALVGRSWQALYPDAEVRRLTSDAFPSLDDGWRWIGDCEMRRDDDTTFTAQTRIDALDDDSLVITVSDWTADD